MSTIEQRVRRIVAEQLGVKEEHFTNEASFFDDLDADSLDTIELILALEEEFEFEISESEAARLSTVQALIDFVTSRTQA